MRKHIPDGHLAGCATRGCWVTRCADYREMRRVAGFVDDEARTCGEDGAVTVSVAGGMVRLDIRDPSPPTGSFARLTPAEARDIADALLSAATSASR